MDSDVQGIILFDEEPITSILSKWMAWMLVMVIFVMVLIYFSNYFARSTECLVAGSPPIYTSDYLLKRLAQRKKAEYYATFLDSSAFK
jgi:hypothetical protein